MFRKIKRIVTLLTNIDAIGKVIIVLAAERLLCAFVPDDLLFVWCQDIKFIFHYCNLLDDVDRWCHSY